MYFEDPLSSDARSGWFRKGRLSICLRKQTMLSYWPAWQVPRKESP